MHQAFSFWRAVCLTNETFLCEQGGERQRRYASPDDRSNYASWTHNYYAPYQITNGTTFGPSYTGQPVKTDPYAMCSSWWACATSAPAPGPLVWAGTNL